MQHSKFFFKSVALVLTVTFMLASCTKQDTFNDLNKTIPQKSSEVNNDKADNLSHVIQFMNNAYTIQNHLENSGNIDSVKYYVNLGINESNVKNVSSLLGFADFEEFEQLMTTQGALASTIDSIYNFSDLSGDDQIQIINFAFPKSNWPKEKSLGYWGCCAEWLCLDVVMTAGCTATGPFAIACGVAAGAYTGLEIEDNC